MRRTEQLQGLRLMKFEEVYGRSCRREPSQLEATEILGISERTFRRWRDRYESEGAEGLYDRRLTGSRDTILNSASIEYCPLSIVPAIPRNSFVPGTQAAVYSVLS